MKNFLIAVIYLFTYVAMFIGTIVTVLSIWLFAVVFNPITIAAGIIAVAILVYTGKL